MPTINNVKIEQGKPIPPELLAITGKVPVKPFEVPPGFKMKVSNEPKPAR